MCAHRAAHGESSWAVSCPLVRLVLSPPPLQTSASADFKQNTGRGEYIVQISWTAKEAINKRSGRIKEVHYQLYIISVTYVTKSSWRNCFEVESKAPLTTFVTSSRSRSEKLWKEAIVLRPISKYFSSLENLLLVISKLDEGVTCKNMTASIV